MRKILAGLLLFIASNVIASDYRMANTVPVTGGTFTGNITAPNLTATYGVSAATGVFTTSIKVSSANASAMVVLGAGDVPTAVFRADDTIDFGSDQVLFRRQSGGSNYLNIGYGNTLNVSGSAMYFGTETGYDLNFRVNNVSKMIINGTTGNVGIGTSAPDYKLQVSSGSVYIDGTGAGLYPNKSATLPTTGYAEGSLFFNSADKALYISTEAVSGTFSWIKVGAQ